MELDLCTQLDTDLFSESLGVLPTLTSPDTDDGEAPTGLPAPPTSEDLEPGPTNSSGRYNLRRTSIDNRVKTERKRRTPKAPKPKSKPAPLSKYRRRTANGRERSRMSQINTAFETLRRAMPTEDPDYATDEKKVTKISTLRLAMRYINELRIILGQEDMLSLSSASSAASSSAGSVSGNERCFSPAHSTGDSVDSGDSGRTSLSPVATSSLDSEGELTHAGTDGWR